MSQLIDKTEEISKPAEKRSFFRRHKILSFFLILLVIMLGLGAQSYFSHETLKSEGWNYSIPIDSIFWDSSRYVAVDYDYRNAAGLEAFANAMRRENEQVFLSGVYEVMPVTIYFNHPLSWDEADTFVKKYGLRASGYNIRVVDVTNAGVPGIMGTGVARNGKTGQGFDDTARQQLEQQLTRINPASSSTYVSKGVITIQVSLDYEEYHKVIADQDVYLVEMLRQVIKNRIKQGPLLDLAFARLLNFDLDNPNVYDIQFGGLPITYYRQLEDFKLVKR